MGETEQLTGAGDKDVGEYVVYQIGDYAGFLRRIAAMAVDLGVLLAILITYTLTLDIIGIPGLDGYYLPKWYLVSILVIPYLYLTLLKRSRIRTPGFWVTGLRIVDLKGRPPSMFIMSLRLFWWVLGPINPLLDLFFMTDDAHRQTIRDKLIGTYVVKKDSAPAGFGRKTIGRTSFMSMMLMYPVVSPASSGGGESKLGPDRSSAAGRISPHPSPEITMPTEAKTVPAFLKTLPDDRREAMTRLRKAIKEHLPKGFQEVMGPYDMPSYVVPHSRYPDGYHCDPKQPLPFVSIASQKGHVGVYHMGVYADPKLLAWFEKEYPKHVKTKLDMGKSCIRFKKVETIPYELIGELCGKMTVEDWIALYEKSVKK